MNNPIRLTKGITRVLHLAFMLMVLALTLSACSQKSNPNEISVSDGTLSAPLPSALLTIDATNLVVGVVVDGGATQTCGGLSVDSGAGTYSCNITLEGGTHNIALVFSISGTPFGTGTVEVAKASGIDVNVVPGQTTTADFSAVVLEMTDTDGDGINNLNELDEGSDPGTSSYYVGGMVSGLLGSGAVIQLNGGNDLTLTSDDSFKFIPAVDNSTA